MSMGRGLDPALAAGMALSLALAPGHAGAASATARVYANVVEPINVVELLGVPLSLAEVVAALQGAPGVNAGVLSIRLAGPLPPAVAPPGPDTSAQAAAIAAATRAGHSGVLLGGLAAAVSLSADGASPSITVAFN